MKQGTYQQQLTMLRMAEEDIQLFTKRPYETDIAFQVRIVEAEERIAYEHEKLNAKRRVRTDIE